MLCNNGSTRELAGGAFLAPYQSDGLWGGQWGSQDFPERGGSRCQSQNETCLWTKASAGPGKTEPFCTALCGEGVS